MNKLRAVLFGIDTLFDGREVEREAFNRVFEEAGLPWRWESADHTRLLRLAAGGDILDAFIRFERPFWRNSEDMKHLLAAVRRRHVSLCRSEGMIAVDSDMARVAETARMSGLRVCAIAPWAGASPAIRNDIAFAQTHGGALAELDVPAAACVAIECTPQGFQAAASAGIVALDKSVLSAPSGAFSDVTIATLLADAHASSTPIARAPRLFATALIA